VTHLSTIFRPSVDKVIFNDYEGNGMINCNSAMFLFYFSFFAVDDDGQFCWMVEHAFSKKPRAFLKPTSFSLYQKNEINFQ
jgi:hypothetical protein